MHRVLNDAAIVHAELRSLCEGFFDDLSWIEVCRVVAATQIAPTARPLLVHHQHMTPVLSDHYGQPVALSVQAYRQEGDVYRRRILLTVAGGSRVVELGVVRLDLSAVDPAVRGPIVERKAPLGEILTAHRVLTRVEPKWFVRLAPDSPVGCAFRPPPVRDVFGRIGRIHCNHQPVMELLEVVSP